MKVHMKLLRCPDDLRTSLRKDGWVIQKTSRKNELDASHPQVEDEDMARIRLQRLGLLTSASLRVEFCPRCKPG